MPTSSFSVVCQRQRHIVRLMEFGLHDLYFPRFFLLIFMATTLVNTTRKPFSDFNNPPTPWYVAKSPVFLISIPGQAVHCALPHFIDSLLHFSHSPATCLFSPKRLFQFLLILFSPHLPNSLNGFLWCQPASQPPWNFINVPAEREMAGLWIISNDKTANEIVWVWFLWRHVATLWFY